MAEDKLTKKQQKVMDNLLEEMTTEAKAVRKDYKDNPSNMSGSLIQVHEQSAYLDEFISGSGWKKVLSGQIPPRPVDPYEKKPKKK